MSDLQFLSKEKKEHGFYPCTGRTKRERGGGRHQVHSATNRCSFSHSSKTPGYASVSKFVIITKAKDVVHWLSRRQWAIPEGGHLRITPTLCSVKQGQFTCGSNICWVLNNKLFTHIINFYNSNKLWIDQTKRKEKGSKKLEMDSSQVPSGLMSFNLNTPAELGDYLADDSYLLGRFSIRSPATRWVCVCSYKVGRKGAEEGKGERDVNRCNAQ